MADKVVKCLVVDSGAFIKHAEFHKIGETIYTLPDVVSEVRDKATRDLLQVLPYELKFREPTPEAIKIVQDFAQQTGDLRSLSLTDIRVMALVYTLEKELVGIDHIRTKPSNKIQYVMPEKAGDNTVMLPGFYVKKNKKCMPKSEHTSSESSSVKVVELSEQLNDSTLDDTQKNSAVEKQSQDGHCADEHTGQVEASVEDAECIEELSADSQDGETDEELGTDDDDDDGGWITPSNLAAVKQAAAALNKTEVESLHVACITTDYAMQNVLVQMGLHVISIDGKLIRRTQSKILRCYGCFKVTNDCQREFCSHCGNKTLSRITVSYNDDGTVQYHLSRHKTFSTRGLRYSLPQPRGGKYCDNPVLCEDQREAQKRLSKRARVKVDVFDPDYTSRSSPFASIDIYSRSAALGYNSRRGTGRRHNPNENNKHYGHRK